MLTDRSRFPDFLSVPVVAGTEGEPDPEPGGRVARVVRRGDPDLEGLLDPPGVIDRVAEPIVAQEHVGLDPPVLRRVVAAGVSAAPAGAEADAQAVLQEGDGSDVRGSGLSLRSEREARSERQG